VRVCVYVCVCVSVAILAQGTNFLLFWYGIEVSFRGCNPAFAIGKYPLYLVIRYLCKLDVLVLSTHRDV
jgi:hypothetical protein